MATYTELVDNFLFDVNEEDVALDRLDQVLHIKVLEVELLKQINDEVSESISVGQCELVLFICASKQTQVLSRELVNSYSLVYFDDAFSEDVGVVAQH